MGGGETEDAPAPVEEARMQKICTQTVHRKGIRASRLCAWKMGALAKDGFGNVERDPDNHSLYTFTEGKRFNCDLSES